MDEIEIVTFNRSEHKQDYLKFIQDNDTMFYHTLKYQEFVAKLLECEIEHILAYENKELVGAIPILSKSVMEGKVINSLPYYGSNGSVIARDESTKEKLIKAYNAYSKSKEVISSTIINTPLNNTFQFEHNLKDYRIGQITEIPSHSNSFEEDFFEVIDSSTRRNIRKARKSNIYIQIDNSVQSVEELFKMHYQNMKDMGGNAKSKSFFENILNSFKPGKDFNIYTALVEDKVVATLLLFYHKEYVEYFTPCTLNEYRNIQPMAEVLYKAFEDAARNNFRYWNWGGTWKSQEGVYKFKSKWGAKDYRYDYYTQLNNVDLLNKTKEDLLAMAGGFYICPFDALKDI